MDVVDRLRNKDEEALRELMDSYGNELIRTAILLVKDEFLAQEIVQDTFITAFKKIHTLEKKEKLKSWLFIITLNGCKARMRSWSWKNIFLSKRGEEFTNIEDSKKIPEQLLIQSLNDGSLHKAIQSLSYPYREAITLFYFQELSIKEISFYIKEKENTVKTRLARARGQLKEVLTKGALHDE
ncbi:sigma-70 family RNA polymerase sigma factor [Evansella cellulosilytica]|uniref:RNA polymerase sigma factor n=1 Tax=Evansella cellulosilytica (strain ATCC 21833 / DSM 2522 / FERM P-1141 / JCM 9156 / N-4) TaxID=649639 RepID=E6TWA5_EVAC2|nr:sigma-70 family RNA polymerase sigma factor [Evansella cellulosilytica]ADU31061.1 RNA polymerase, sigma-24 subunit, ECF subfamily [Evansella cellulosilytica DSM 2522]